MSVTPSLLFGGKTGFETVSQEEQEEFSDDDVEKWEEARCRTSMERLCITACGGGRENPGATVSLKVARGAVQTVAG